MIQQWYLADSGVVSSHKELALKRALLGMSPNFLHCYSVFFLISHITILWRTVKGSLKLKVDQKLCLSTVSLADFSLPISGWFTSSLFKIKIKFPKIRRIIDPLHSSDPPCVVVGGSRHFGPPRPRWGLGLFLVLGGALQIRWDIFLLGGGWSWLAKII